MLALVIAAAGAGYSAGRIGTKDLKNNAVTSPKVKNGSLTRADLIKERKATVVAAAGGVDFTTGGQGDCLWVSGANEIPGVADPSYRTDRFGTVHLTGVAVSSDAPGGDGDGD